MKFEKKALPVETLEVCDRARVRKQKPKDGSDIVLEYAGAYEAGLILEPLDVFREKGTERYVVADGEHRLLALRRAKIKEVECRLYEGDEVDALEFATHCNQKHGLRRTKADIYHAFTRIKETPRLEAKYRTDTDFALQLGVSPATIARYKCEWRESNGGNKRVRARKQEAKNTAKRHSPEKPNLSVIGSKATDSKEKFPETARKTDIPPAKPVLPAQGAAREETAAAQPAPDGAAPAPPAPAKESPRLAASLVANIRQAIALLGDVPADANLIGIKLNAWQVKHALAVLGALPQ